jgi:hypothetical protein
MNPFVPFEEIPIEERDSPQLDLGEDSGRRDRTDLVWNCSCREPIEGEHYTHNATSAAGKYFLSVSTSFPGFKFNGYGVSFRPTGARGEQDIELGNKRKLEDAKAIAQRHADKSKSPARVAPELSQIDAAFEEFWRVYPLKKAKEEAKTAYRNIIKKKKVSTGDLLAGVMRYAAERSGQPPKYTKHPATWLNKGCWEDEPIPGGNSMRPPTDHNAISEQLARQAMEKNGGGHVH